MFLSDGVFLYASSYSSVSESFVYMYVENSCDGSVSVSSFTLFVNDSIYTIVTVPTIVQVSINMRSIDTSAVVHIDMIFPETL